MLPFIFWCLSRCSSEDRHLAGMISHQKTRYAWKGALGVQHRALGNVQFYLQNEASSLDRSWCSWESGAQTPLS